MTEQHTVIDHALREANIHDEHLALLILEQIANGTNTREKIANEVRRNTDNKSVLSSVNRIVESLLVNGYGFKGLNDIVLFDDEERAEISAYVTSIRSKN